MKLGATTTYRLGVDVGGTFTDLIMINKESGETYTSKVPSTPHDSSVGVLNGIAKICEQNGIDARNITHVMHGTTVATNTVLEGKGARVGLITTKGYRHVLQMARSFVPGGLGGWVIYNKRPLMAPLELTIEADERMDAGGVPVQALDEGDLRAKLERLKKKDIEALTVCLVNSYANGAHEVRVREIAESVLGGVPVSISSEVIPEMYEYERTETTVVNSYIRPIVSRYMESLHRELGTKMEGIKLQVLRSDGGLASVEAARNSPVNLLMSGPAGGVAGALWVAKHANYKNLLTFDMGGTSTDVALIKDGVAQTRRETRVSDVNVRVPSIDVRTVGAGGGSIAYVPELTKALRVGPQSAGAVPGPAAYMKGGTKPTVTDANVVLGYLPTSSKLGGDMRIDRSLAEQAIATIAGPLGKSIKEAAEGVVNIVNENMFGALRLVSIEQGYDPRDFALIAFGGAGPLHANALGKLMGSWPVIIPPSPGVLCAYGDATTRLRDEASRTFIRRLDDTSDKEVLVMLEELTGVARRSLVQEGLPDSAQTVSYQIDLRYRGQGMSLTIMATPEQFKQEGLAGVAKQFDEMHTQLYTFALDVPHELVNLRAVIEGPETLVKLESLQRGTGDSSGAVIDESEMFFEGQERQAKIYDRTKLRSGDVIPGPAIVCQMDATTVILPDHTGVVDAVANIIIRPNN
jgi:N-methylhydantoinase A